jgi:DNA mismatch endonuclease (patch repair protein)
VKEDPETRSRIMRAVQGRDTAPEFIVRRLAHSMGYRYRLHRKDLPGKPDMAFPGRRKVIFIHGCFWHGHVCARGSRVPKNNRDYWIKKIESNQTRDRKSLDELSRSGWQTLVLWECELRDQKRLRRRLHNFLANDPRSDDNIT